MEVSNNSQTQWVEELILLRCLNRYIPNRIIPRWKRIGSTDTDRQSNSKWRSVWVDYYQPVPSDSPPFSLSKSTRVMTTDLKATNYVLFNNYDYPKPEMVKNIMRRLFGSGAFFCTNWGIPCWCYYYSVFYIGLLCVDGDEHKHQVGLLLQDSFINCSLILQIAQDFGQSFWTRVLNI